MAFAILAIGSAASSRAEVYLRVESSGFLKRAQDRADSSTTLVAGPELRREGKLLSGELDLKAITFLSDVSSFTIEATNAYVATSPQLDPRHQFTLGRRIYDWSVADDAWNLGTWSPNFQWDPIRPETVGNTGAFYSYESPRWRFLAFASPISVPERGFPIRQENGRLTSASGDFVPPYQQLQVMNEAVDIHYNLAIPPIGELLLHPGGAASLRYGEKLGPWASAGYAILPMHQLNLAAEAELGLQPVLAMDVTIHPRVLYHQLLTAELGNRSRNTSLWASITREVPIDAPTPAEWITDPIGPAVIASIGAEWRWREIIRLRASALSINEAKRASSGDSMGVQLPSRFPFERAVLFGAHWDALPALATDLLFRSDLAQASNLLSLDLIYRFDFNRDGLRGWQVGLGADVFQSSTGKGLIGQYYDNDRFRARVSYAF